MKQIIFAATVLFALCLFSTSSFSQITTYTVTNNTGMVLTGVSLSPNDLNTWGTALNTTGNVALNGTFSFNQLADRNNCTYDLRYQAEDGTYYYVQDVDLCNSTTITLSAPVKRDDMDKK